MTAPGPLSDDPRDGSAERPDLLNRHEYVTGIASLLEVVRRQSESSVLALIGDWGSGKSSVFEMLREVLLNQEDPWCVGAFNPWAYPDAESIQAGFFVELYSALPEDAHEPKFTEKMATLARRLSPLGALAGAFGVDGKELMQAGADLLGGAESLDASIRSAASDLRRIDRPVLIVMDDIDRLTPDELLTVLKLVRLIGRLPNVYYLLGYDEATLVDVLSSTPLVKTPERAQAYLEKVVQVRLDMPMLRSSEKLALLDHSLEALCTEAQVTLTADDFERISRMYESAFERSLNTPRAINRLIGQVQAFYPHLRDEVDFVDFLLISWVRTIEPEVYRMIQRESTYILGGSLSLTWGLRKDPSAARERQNFWRKRLSAANVSEDAIEPVVTVLGELFPEIRAAFASADKWEEPRNRTTLKAVSERDYFERYMVFGVPSDDLRDSVVAQAMRDLAAGAEGAAVDEIRRCLVSKTELVLSKIRSLRFEGQELPNWGLAQLLLEVSPDATQEGSLFSASPIRIIERELARCLARVDASQSASLFDGMTGLEDRGNRAINAVRELYWDQQRGDQLIPDDSRDLSGLFDAASAHLQSVFGRRTSNEPLTADEVSGFLTWYELDGDAAVGWASRLVSENVWTIETAAISMVTPGQRNSSSGLEYVAGGLLSEILTRIIPIDQLLDNLRHVVTPPIQFHEAYDYSSEGRLHCAVAELRRIAGRQSDSPA